MTFEKVAKSERYQRKHYPNDRDSSLFCDRPALEFRHQQIC
ncbi:MAG TPA: hypothetical protein V6D12_13505 [Candidatus Obscuribacterales bacterium]